MSARRLRAGIGCVMLGLATTAGAQAATSRVTYLAGGSVYVEAGRLEGLVEGDTLQVLSRGRAIARLVVRFLSSHRAACDTLQASAMPAAGDVVRYRARSAPQAPPPLAAAPDSGAADPGPARLAPAASTAPATARSNRLRGRLGVRFLVVDASDGAGFSQPALDLRLDGTDLGGRPVDLAVDVRGRRTLYRGPAAADRGEARVYRLAATFRDRPGRRRVTVGRQLGAGYAPVGLFDGALVEVAGERWGAGLLSGAQPDPETWRVSGASWQHGGFVTRRGRQGERRWSATAGGIASFDRGQVDRQFGFVQGSYASPRLDLHLTEEVDLNTGWKRALGEPLVSPTSTFASARARLARGVSVHAGYDNRRNVMLYRDRLTPEIEFDDRHRQGAWVGSAVEPIRHLRLAADARWSGGAAGEYTSWSTSAEARRLPLLQADLRWRTTSFGGVAARGRLHAAGLAVRPGGASRLELGAGTRSSRDAVSQLETRARWAGVDLDLGLARRWYLLISAQRERGDGLDTRQGYASLSWMF